MRVLLSGFEPFGGESMNPSASLMNEIRSGRVRIPDDVEVRAVVLPVTFEGGPQILLAEIRAFDPEVVIAFGMAGGRAAIEFERVAVNLIDAEFSDNAGMRPHDVPVDPTGPAACFTTLPIRALSERLVQEGIPSRISNTAGLFVCNATMYRLLRDPSERRSCGFVHVPYLPEQDQTPAMPLGTLVRALELILSEVTKRDSLNG